MSPFELYQSGIKQTFATGAQRDSDEGKSAQWMLSPLFEERLGHLLEKGAKHYGTFNYMKGFPISRTLASTKRHQSQYLSKLLGFRPDDKEDHATMAAFGWMLIVHTEEAVKLGLLPEELLDVKPPTTPPEQLHDHEDVKRELLSSDSEGAPPQTFTIDEVKVKLQLAWQAGFTEGRIKAAQVRRLEARLRLDGGHAVQFYVAGPYTGDGSDEQKDANREKAIEISQEIAAKGHYVHIPHSATDPLDNIPGCDWSYFMTHDLMLIERSMDALFYIGPSPGADVELAEAKRLGLPVFTSIDDVPTVTQQRKPDERLEGSSQL